MERTYRRIQPSGLRFRGQEVVRKYYPSRCEIYWRFRWLRGYVCVQLALISYFRIASATAFISGSLTAGLGPNGNGVMPFLATNAACHPAFIAPNTSHGCAAMSRSSPGRAPRCTAALRYVSKSGLNRRTESTEIDSSKYWVRPAFWSCALTADGLEFVSVTMRKPAARKRFRLSGTSGCAGIVRMPCKIRVASSEDSLTPFVFASISRTALPTAPKSE